MASPVIHVVERNPYAPRPFVFTEVALCLRDSLRAAGIPCEHQLNRIDPQAWSIVLGGRPEFETALEHLDPEHCAIFNFEQLGSASTMAGDDYVRWLSRWLVLDYHSHNIEVLRRTNGPAQRALELPLRPSTSLFTDGPEVREVDVLFYGTLNDRRSALMAELSARGLRVEVVAGAYGIELAPAVRRARLVVHAHFYATGLFPVLRFLQPAAMGVPIVCEHSVFSAMNDWSASGIVFADYAQLADRCVEVLAAPERLQQLGARVQAFGRSHQSVAAFQRLAAALGGQPARPETLSPAA